MSFASKHNTSKLRFTFEIPEHFQYTNLKELAKKNGLDTVYQVNAIYIGDKGKFGPAPVLVTNNELVNAPQHLTERAKQIMADPEDVDAINNGKVGFKVYTYENDFGTNYGLEWLDV